MEKVKIKQPVTHASVQQGAQKSVPHHHQQQQQHPFSEPQMLTEAHCKSHMHRYVEVKGRDGCCYDGIVEHVDKEWLCLAVPGSVDEMRGFFGPPFSPFNPYFPYRPRRFNRLILPLAGLAAISLLPYYW